MKQTYLILFEDRQNYEVYEGTLQNAVTYLKELRKSANSRQGARIYVAELLYEIDTQPYEKWHEQTEQAARAVDYDEELKILQEEMNQSDQAAGV